MEPNTEYSAAEVSCYAALFKACDVQRVGIITPALAVPFMSKSRLSQEQLALIWQIADREQKGFLSHKTFSIAMKLIAAAQHSGLINQAQLGTPSAIMPVLEGIDTGPLMEKISAPSAISATFECSIQDRERYTVFFESCQPSNNLIAANNAKQVFLKSALPLEILNQIWKLIDPSNSSKIGLEMFLVAMVLITKIKTGALPNCPVSIPPDLLASIHSNTSKPPIISADDLSRYESYFNSLDTAQKGVLTGKLFVANLGSETYTFFLKSKLPESELSHIWYRMTYPRSIVDNKNSGKITKEGFITIMTHIKHRMEGKPLPIKIAAAVNLATESLDTIDMSFLGSPRAAVPSPSKQVGIFQYSAEVSSLTNNRLTNPRPILSEPSPSFSSGQPSIYNALEVNNIVELQYDHKIKSDELHILRKQLEQIKPSFEEIQEKRVKIEAEFRETSETRNQINAELVQTRAMYEAEKANVKDIRALLTREYFNIEAVKAELEAGQTAIQALLVEKIRLSEEHTLVLADSEKLQISISKLVEETVKLRENVETSRLEYLRQQQIAGMNNIYLKQAQDQYRQVKSENDQINESLDLSVQKNLQLKQQTDVQLGIIRRENEKLGQINKSDQFGRSEADKITLESVRTESNNSKTVRSLDSITILNAVDRQGVLDNDDSQMKSLYRFDDIFPNPETSSVLKSSTFDSSLFGPVKPEDSITLQLFANATTSSVSQAQKTENIFTFDQQFTNGLFTNESVKLEADSSKSYHKDPFELSKTSLNTSNSIFQFDSNFSKANDGIEAGSPKKPARGIREITKQAEVISDAFTFDDTFLNLNNNNSGALKPVIESAFKFDDVFSNNTVFPTTQTPVTSSDFDNAFTVNTIGNDGNEPTKDSQYFSKPPINNTTNSVPKLSTINLGEIISRKTPELDIIEVSQQAPVTSDAFTFDTSFSNTNNIIESLGPARIEASEKLPPADTAFSAFPKINFNDQQAASENSFGFENNYFVNTNADLNAKETTSLFEFDAGFPSVLNSKKPASLFEISTQTAVMQDISSSNAIIDSSAFSAFQFDATFDSVGKETAADLPRGNLNIDDAFGGQIVENSNIGFKDNDFGFGPPPPEPSQLTKPQDSLKEVQDLVAMGFSETDSISALEKSGYNIAAAINLLLLK